MEIQQIPQADLLDILFDGRNKEYGAYDLRKHYNSRLTKAMLLTGSICLALIGSYTLAQKLHKTVIVVPPAVTEVILDKAVLPEKNVVVPRQAKSNPTPQLKVATINDAAPKITPDEQVKTEDKPHTQEEMEHVTLGSTNTPGDASTDIVAPPQNNGNGTGVTVAPEKKDVDDGIVIGVEIEATYPGGMQAWQRFLQKNFHIPEQAIAENTAGTVIVQFVVDKEGNVSDVEAISGPEILRQEAVRIIRKSGKWGAGIQNGRKVNSYKKQPIVVQLQEE
jgi:protein TonB